MAKPSVVWPQKQVPLQTAFASASVGEDTAGMDVSTHKRPTRDTPTTPDNESTKIARLQAIKQSSPSTSSVPQAPIPRLPIELDDSQQSHAQASSPNPILDAITALTNKVDQLALTTATKADMAALSSEINQNTQVMIAEAVDPLKSEIHDIKQQQQQQHARLTAIEAGPPAASASTNQHNTQPSEEIRKLTDSLDPAKKRISFIGWPDSVTPDARMKEIQLFLDTHSKSNRPTYIDNFHTGPHNDRKVTHVAFAEFSSRTQPSKRWTK